MKRLFFLAITLLALVAPLGAQGTVGPGSHRWAGVWTDPEGVIFAFRLELTLGQTGRAAGAFKWTLLEAPAERVDLRRLDEGTEWVQGAIDPQTAVISLRGTRVDREDLLVTDEYVLRIGPDGSIDGITRSNEGGRLAGMLLSSERLK